MPHLVAALERLGLQGTVKSAGTWIQLQGEHCLVNVAEGRRSTYYVWCDPPGETRVERFDDPVDAIQAGLRRASHPPLSPTRPD